MCRSIFTSDELEAFEVAFERAAALLGFAPRDHAHRAHLAMLMFSLIEDGPLDFDAIETAAVFQMRHPQ
jgi:hypothetical protein